MIDIVLEWSKARLGYECANVEEVRVIRQVGKARDTVEPLKIEGDEPLYIRFSKLDGSEKSCLQFASAFGLLTKKSPAQVERLDAWRKEIRNINSMMSALRVKDSPPGGILRANRNSSRVEVPLPLIKVTLVPGKFDIDGISGRPNMLLEPQDLLGAMYLQLGQFVATDGSLRMCKQCGQPFECGAAESRRSIAIFCSEKCKNRFHYLERAKR